MMKSNGQSPPSDNGKPRWDSARLAELVEEVLVPGIQREIEKHHRDGYPVAIWRDGQEGWLYPDGTFRVEDDEKVTAE